MSSCSSEESEDDWEEPQLKYDRMGNDLLEILRKDAASCIALHEKFVALGTHWGTVHILDHQGNNITNKQFTSHSTTVTGIALDEPGEHVASCSDDGIVSVSGLLSDAHNQLLTLDQPVKAVALEPGYTKGSSKKIVIGTDRLILSERSWLRRSQQTQLHSGEGLVRNIKWRSTLIAWANDKGVKVYDTKQNRRITHIPRSNEASSSTNLVRPEIYPAHITWKDDNTLLVGWFNDIKVCEFRPARDREGSRHCVITHLLKTDFACCGIVPLGDQIVSLAFIVAKEELNKSASGGESSQQDEVSKRPELRILEPDRKNRDGYVEISRDALSIRGFQSFRCNDYSLASAGGELYVVSPKDIVIAQQRDEDDKITWLLQINHHREALEAVKQFGKRLKKHTYMEVGKSYLTHLLDIGDFREAAQNSQEILGNNMMLWEDIVDRFSSEGKLSVIAPFLPLGDHHLSEVCYEKVLGHFLKNDHLGFANLLGHWPSNLYNIQSMTMKVLKYLDRDPKNEILLDALAKLHIADQRFDRALSIYLRLQHPASFALIRKHNLYKALQENILPLMLFNKEEAVDLLLDHMEYVPIDQVVAELKDRPNHLHKYLHALFLRDSHLGGEYHSLQIRLYAEFDRRKLLPFLKSSTYIALEEALKICEEREYVKEQVFLLGRMGNASRALALITEHESDVSSAIEFCKEQNDTQLWNELIDKSIHKPEFIRGLLENIGTHVDPIILIKKIPTGMNIPGLRDALVKILQDYSMQTALWFECKHVLSSDVLALMRKQLKISTRPLKIDEDRVCDACGRNLICKTGAFGSRHPLDLPVVVCFLCQHYFHDECLPSQNQGECSVCKGKVRHR
uniref:Vacuolar protein sorting-associated protein 41 n=1 Tax=Phallusia mammillata TaxID=59560 RepID=A0A6F9DW46_9ASCI|nr:Vacuolar protein sorting-associated protein 41 [Phallusia mammillata]